MHWQFSFQFETNWHYAKHSLHWFFNVLAKNSIYLVCSDWTFKIWRSNFELKIHFSLWHVSHSIACLGYTRPASPTVDDPAPASCSILILDQVECNLPLCPMVNDSTASGLDPVSSGSKLLTEKTDQKNGSVIQYQCSKKCELEVNNRLDQSWWSRKN